MKPDKQVWIVEDDPGAQFVYREILKSNFDFTIFPTLSEFMRTLRKTREHPDLLIADLRLGNESFLSFLADQANQRKLSMPFIIVSSVDDIDILRLCFDQGAADYLTKPFTKSELLVKAERLVFRVNKPAQLTSQHPDATARKLEKSSMREIVFDPSTLTVRRGVREIIHLTAKELQLYSLLHRAGGETVSRRQLEIKIWGRASVTAKSLDVHIFNLRKKVAQFGIEIVYSSPNSYFLKYPE